VTQEPEGGIQCQKTLASGRTADGPSIGPEMVYTVNDTDYS
jgi:hypothetical protein